MEKVTNKPAVGELKREMAELQAVSRRFRPAFHDYGFPAHKIGYEKFISVRAKPQALRDCSRSLSASGRNPLRTNGNRPTNPSH